MIDFPSLRRKSALRTIDSAELHGKIIGWGATVAGFGDVSTGLAPEFRQMPTAVSLAIRHPVGRGTYRVGPLTAYSNQFADVDRQLEMIQSQVATLLKSQGWRTLIIPPDSAKADGHLVAALYSLFPHKTAATCAGLGWIGKSGLLINPRYGPRLSWGTVLTDAPLQVCSTPYLESRCGNCRRCARACPAGAIGGVNWKRSERNTVFIDVQACADYLQYSARYFQKYICGICLLACPLGDGQAGDSC
jgi:epoxyqueuosine reductase